MDNRTIRKAIRLEHIVAIEPCEQYYSRSLNELENQTMLTEVWLFEPSEARRAMETALAEKGQTIKIHSAYKTLLHNVLEHQLFDDAISVTIRYPVVAEDEPLRFRLECYPLQDLFADVDISFLPVNHDDENLPAYQLNIQTAQEQRACTVEVPVRWKDLVSGRRSLVASGWQKTAHGLSIPMTTEYEQVFDDISDYLQTMPLQPLQLSESKGPFFDQLLICVTAPFQDQPLTVGHEVISLAEALHEEIYFTGLEIYQKRLGLPALSRDMTPGQVVPLICKGEKVYLSIFAGKANPQSDVDQVSGVSLPESTHWLYPSQVRANLRQINGQIIQASSRQDRLVEGRIVQVEGLPESARIAISAAQHANESSGVVAALRAAFELQKTGQISFSVCPVENVDGYALFHTLCRQHPEHMHHAARYTAGGNDLANGVDKYESAIRSKAWRALPARVHVNLHGYPAHEWTRPLSGYVPEGFSRWTIPKGFFLICDYADESQQSLARQVLDAALHALYEYSDMMAINRRMLQSYENVIGSVDFQIYRDCIPYSLTCRAREPYPISLTTEAPDETIYGEDFRVAHEAHYRVVMAVADLLATQPTDIFS